MQKNRQMTREDVINLLRRDVARLGSQKRLAQEIGVSEPHISEMLNGTRDPGPVVLKHYGIERIVVYRPSTNKQK